MSDEENKSQDSLADLLDSFEAEDVLSQKMSSFAKNREEQKKIEQERRKNLPENEYTIKEDMDAGFPQPVSQKTEPADMPKLPETRKAAASPEEGQTMVFSQSRNISPAASGSDTIVYSEKQVSQMASQPAGLKLVKKEEEDSDHSRKAATIVLIAVLCVSLAALAGFGIYHFASAMTGSKPADTAGFDEMLKWAEKYDNFGDLEKENLLKYESIYNKLSQDQKKQINDALKSITGKTYDELLAEATSKDKENTSSNYTEIAEEKARIRMAIAALENQIAANQQSLDAVNAQIDEAYQDFLTAQNDYAQAQSDKSDADEAYLDAVQEYSQAMARSQELQAKADDKSITPEEQKELDGMEDKLSDLSKALSQADTARQDAADQVDEAAQAYTDAANYYNSIKDSAAPYEAAIADLQSQVDAKRQELQKINAKNKN